MSKRARNDNQSDVGGSNKPRKKSAGSSGGASVPKKDHGWSQAEFEQAVKAQIYKEKAKNAHYVDLANATHAANTTGSIALIATMPSGVTSSSRVGKKAAYKSLQIRGQVTSDTTCVSAMATLMVVYDRKPTNALPTINEILDTISSYSFLKDVNSDRFQIVRRWDYMLCGPSGAGVTSASGYVIDEYVKLNKRPIEYNAAGTGAIGDIAKGALYLVAVGNQVSGTADARFDVGCRTRFVDIDG